jgi:alcohol dehydrogenase class IV
MSEIDHLTVLPQEEVIWGAGALIAVLKGLKAKGIVRPIAFTTISLRERNGEIVLPNLVDCVGTVTQLPAHAPEAAITTALEACRRQGAQSIVAHGGGSVLDAAKAVSFLHEQRTGRYLPIVALPTTLSGSEFSHYFGITGSSERGAFKKSYAVKRTVPAIVVLDPVLLLDTPRSLLLSSAIKGIDHAVEGMRTVSLDHPHSIMAASGFEQFFSVLSKWPKQITTRDAIANRTVSMDALQQLQLAAWRCYYSPASVIYGLSHRIGHILGGTFGLPHSATSCITLVPVIRACADFYGDKLSIFAGGNAGSSAEVVSARIKTLVEQLGLPTKLVGYGLGKAETVEVIALLKSNYPKEVKDLGDGAEGKLERLMDSLW